MKRDGKRGALVVGLGRFGSAAAERLMTLGWDVVGIDCDPEAVRAMRDRLSHVVELDASDEAALATVGIPEFDACIVSGASSVETSILLVLNLQNLGAKCIVAKAATEHHARILRRLGVDQMVFPERDAGAHLAEGLQSPYLVEWIDLDPGRELAALRVPERQVGRALKQWRELRKSSLTVLARLNPAGQPVPLDGDAPLQAGETIVVVGAESDILALGQ